MPAACHTALPPVVPPLLLPPPLLPCGGPRGALLFAGCLVVWQSVEEKDGVVASTAQHRHHCRDSPSAAAACTNMLVLNSGCTEQHHTVPPPSPTPPPQPHTREPIAPALLATHVPVAQYYDRVYPYLIKTYPNMWKADVNDLDSFTWVRALTRVTQLTRSLLLATPAPCSRPPRTAFGAWCPGLPC